MLTIVATIPTYFPRKSRTEIKKLLATDSTLAAKLSKTSTKKSSVASGKAPAAKPDRVAVRALAGTKRRAPSSSGDESSDNDSAANSSDEESEMPSPLPAVRPTVALEAVKYDTLKALWRPTNRAATADEIRTGLKAFWEVIQTIRDRWKADVAAVKQAEETKKLGELPLLKERVQTQRQMLEAALKAALESGHPDILEQYVLSSSPLPLLAQIPPYIRQFQPSTALVCTSRGRNACHFPIRRRVAAFKLCTLLAFGAMVSGVRANCHGSNP